MAALSRPTRLDSHCVLHAAGHPQHCCADQHLSPAGGAPTPNTGPACSPSCLGPSSSQQRAAEQRLLAAHGAQEARDVHVRLHVLDHSARLAFLPAFHLEYEHGEAFNVHGERVPARYEALISGTGAQCCSRRAVHIPFLFRQL